MDGILERIQQQLERIELRLAKCDMPLGGFVDQKKSPLGPRKHCEAVRRRLTGDEGGAAIVGRRHLLTSEALQDEMRRESIPANTTTAAVPAEEDESYRDFVNRYQR